MPVGHPRFLFNQILWAVFCIEQTVLN